MKTRKRCSISKPTDQQAQQLCDAIHALGDYERVRLRAERGHLNIYPDEYEPVARFSIRQILDHLQNRNSQDPPIPSDSLPRA